MAGMNMQLSKEQQQYLVFAVMLLGGGGYGYVRYFWLPTAARIQESSAKIKDMEDKINKAKSQAVRLPKIQREIEVLNEQAAQAERRLPKSKDLPAVIVTLSGLLRKNNVEMQTFTPVSQVTRDYFIEIPYTIVMRGAYHDVARFFASLALEERIFNVRNVVYGAPDAAGRLGITYTLVAYQYKG